MHYYSHNIGDFAVETRGLTYEQIGIYVTLIDRYASTEAPLTDAWVALAYQGESKCSAIALLEAFFAKQDGGWIHPRLRESIENYAALSEKRRAAGKKGVKAKASATANSLISEDVKQVPSNCSANADITNNHKPITNKEEERVVERKTARAPMTKKLDADTLPDAWKDYCAQVRPDLDPQTVFTSFSFYYRSGNGAATLRSSKGWSQAWQNWVRREKAQKPAAKPGAPVHDKDGRLVNYMSVDFNQLDYHDGVNPDGSF